jgi:CRISPR-associated protein Csb1
MTAWNDVANDMLAKDGPAALVCRQWLMPVTGHGEVIFPPTFAATEAGRSGYNIDPPKEDSRPDTKRIAIIDTVGAQANRMEPLFKRQPGDAIDGDPFPLLVPQIDIQAGNRTINLLDAGHRAADAIVRYSTLGPALKEAFSDYQQSGDATRLAKIAPTSLVFGAWDSRDTQVKLPRLVASTIRAYDVEELTRSAQYNPPLDYIDLGLLDQPDDKKVLDTASELGFRHAPAAGTHGGVIAHGGIRREAILSLVGLRSIGPRGPTGDALRRYVLGLSLVAMIYERAHDLRQGCLLVGDPDKPATWDLVGHDGKRTTVAPDAKATLAFAQAAARAFGVGESRTVAFDRNAANAAIQDKMGGKKGRGKRGKDDAGD